MEDYKTKDGNASDSTFCEELETALNCTLVFGEYSNDKLSKNDTDKPRPVTDSITLTNYFDSIKFTGSFDNTALNEVPCSGDIVESPQVASNCDIYKSLTPNYSENRPKMIQKRPKSYYSPMKLRRRAITPIYNFSHIHKFTSTIKYTSSKHYIKRLRKRVGLISEEFEDQSQFIPVIKSSELVTRSEKIENEASGLQNKRKLRSTCLRSVQSKISGAFQQQSEVSQVSKASQLIIQTEEPRKVVKAGSGLQNKRKVCKLLPKYAKPGRPKATETFQQQSELNQVTEASQLIIQTEEPRKVVKARSGLQNKRKICKLLPKYAKLDRPKATDTFQQQSELSQVTEASRLIMQTEEPKKVIYAESGLQNKQKVAKFQTEYLETGQPKVTETVQQQSELSQVTDSSQVIIIQTEDPKEVINAEGGLQNQRKVAKLQSKYLKTGQPKATEKFQQQSELSQITDSSQVIIIQTEEPKEVINAESELRNKVAKLQTKYLKTKQPKISEFFRLKSELTQATEFSQLTIQTKEPKEIINAETVFQNKVAKPQTKYLKTYQPQIKEAFQQQSELTQVIESSQISQIEGIENTESETQTKRMKLTESSLISQIDLISDELNPVQTQDSCLHGSQAGEIQETEGHAEISLQSQLQTEFQHQIEIPEIIEATRVNEENSEAICNTESLKCIGFQTATQVLEEENNLKSDLQTSKRTRNSQKSNAKKKPRRKRKLSKANKENLPSGAEHHDCISLEEAASLVDKCKLGFLATLTAKKEEIFANRKASEGSKSINIDPSQKFQLSVEARNKNMQFLNFISQKYKNLHKAYGQ